MNNFYRKEIDFLRAIAVIFVILFHYFPNLLPKGYLGVDLFFVISGFLISFQIYDQSVKNKFSIKNFYIRRVKRILPATIFTLTVVFLVCLLLLTYADFISFLKSLIYSLFFSSNFFFWTNGGYFGPNDELKPLLHFWSLGIEEQFYIFFPIIFIFFIKFFKNKNFLLLTVFLITLLSLLLNIILINFGGSNPAFFLLPTRVWNLGFGVLAMLILVKKNKIHTNLETIFFFFLIILGFFYSIPELPKNFLVIFACFMLLRKKLPINFTFNYLIKNKYFNYLGLISFSLYLWHWPILVFFKYYYVYEVSIWIKIFSLFLVFCISIFSYHFIELPFRYKLNFKYLIYLLFFIYIFYFIFSYFSFTKNKPEYEVNSPNFIANSSLTNFKCKTNNYFLYNKIRGCLINRKGKNDYDLAIIGNSHAQMYIPSILPFLKKNSKKAILLPMTGCLPTLTVNIGKSCFEISKNYFKKYTSDDQIKTILIGTTWWHKKIYNGKEFVSDTDHMLVAKSLLLLIQELSNLGKEVYLVGPIQVPLYELPQDLSRLLKFKHINKNELDEKLKIDIKIYKKNYEKVNIFLSENLKNNYIDLSETQCDQKYCYYSDKNGIFFADGSHISSYGAKLFSKKFEHIFK